MFRKPSAVPLLLWLLVAQFFSQIEGNSTIPLPKGNIYLGDCGSCCKRWFITFNGAEYSGPLPMDVAVWIRNKDEDNQRPGAIEGYCDNIHKGKVRVGINTGNCPGHGNSNGNTGWISVSRLIIEEVPQSQ